MLHSADLEFIEELIIEPYLIDTGILLCCCLSRDLAHFALCFVCYFGEILLGLTLHATYLA